MKKDLFASTSLAIFLAFAGSQPIFGGEGENEDQGQGSGEVQSRLDALVHSEKYNEAFMKEFRETFFDDWERMMRENRNGEQNEKAKALAKENEEKVIKSMRVAGSNSALHTMQYKSLQDRKTFDTENLTESYFRVLSTNPEKLIKKSEDNINKLKKRFEDKLERISLFFEFSSKSQEEIDELKKFHENYEKIEGLFFSMSDKLGRFGKTLLNIEGKLSELHSKINIEEIQKEFDEIELKVTNSEESDNIKEDSIKSIKKYLNLRKELDIICRKFLKNGDIKKFYQIVLRIIKPVYIREDIEFFDDFERSTKEQVAAEKKKIDFIKKYPEFFTIIPKLRSRQLGITRPVHWQKETNFKLGDDILVGVIDTFPSPHNTFKFADKASNPEEELPDEHMRGALSHGSHVAGIIGGDEKSEMQQEWNDLTIGVALRSKFERRSLGDLNSAPFSWERNTIESIYQNKNNRLKEIQGEIVRNPSQRKEILERQGFNSEESFSEFMKFTIQFIRNRGARIVWDVPTIVDVVDEITTILNSNGESDLKSIVRDKPIVKSRAPIFNMSICLSSLKTSGNEEDTALEGDHYLPTLTKLLQDRLMVFCMCNDGVDVSTSKHYRVLKALSASDKTSPRAIMVTNLMQDGLHLYKTSNIPGADEHLQSRTLSALGTRVVSSVAKTASNDPDYGKMDGTSMAAPHVSGVAAVILSNFPELTADELATCLLKGAKPILMDKKNEPYEFKEKMIAGKDKKKEKPLADARDIPALPTTADSLEQILKKQEAGSSSLDSTTASQIREDWKRGKSYYGMGRVHLEGALHEAFALLSSKNPKKIEEYQKILNEYYSPHNPQGEPVEDEKTQKTGKEIKLNHSAKIAAYEERLRSQKAQEEIGIEVDSQLQLPQVSDVLRGEIKKFIESEEAAKKRKNPHEIL